VAIQIAMSQQAFWIVAGFALAMTAWIYPCLSAYIRGQKPFSQFINIFKFLKKSPHGMIQPTKN